MWAAVVFNETPTMTAGSASGLPMWQYSIRINGSFTGTTDPTLQTVDPSNFASVTHNESLKCAPPATRLSLSLSQQRTVVVGFRLACGLCDLMVHGAGSARFRSAATQQQQRYLWTGAALLQWGLDQAIARVSSGGVRDPAVPDYPQYNKNNVTSVRPCYCSRELSFGSLPSSLRSSNACVWQLGALVRCLYL